MATVGVKGLTTGNTNTFL